MQNTARLDLAGEAVLIEPVSTFNFPANGEIDKRLFRIILLSMECECSDGSERTVSNQSIASLKAPKSMFR